jgi:hypothetical protein
MVKYLTFVGAPPCKPCPAFLLLHKERKREGRKISKLKVLSF